MRASPAKAAGRSAVVEALAAISKSAGPFTAVPGSDTMILVVRWSLSLVDHRVLRGSVELPGLRR